MHLRATIGDTVYFGFGANLTTGAAGDGATPTFQIRLAGASSSDAPVLSGTPTLLSHASHIDGSYEVAVAATVANGFAVGATYLVYGSLTIDSVTPIAFIGSFTLAPSLGTYTRIGTAQAGSSTGITLDAGASANNQSYRDQHCRIVAGTGSGQVQLITNYNGTTKVATVTPSWVGTAPDSTSVFVIIPGGSVDVYTWVGNLTTVGAGSRPAVDAAAISGSTTAADNVESNIGNLDAASSSLATAAALTTHDGKLDTVDGVVDAIKVITDAIGSTAAARLALSAGQIIPFTVDTVTNTHTPTTTEFQADDITEVTADHYNGRIVVWTTGALTGQATSISDYALVGGIGQLTVVGMTEAPANNDTGIIV